MRKIKNISLALTLVPLLFVGCVQEKVSRIIPSKSTDNHSQTLISKADISLKAKDSSNKIISESELDRLVSLVQQNLAQEAIQKKKISKPQITTSDEEPLLELTYVEDPNILADEDSLSNEIQISDADIGDDNIEVDNSDSLDKLTALVSNELDSEINGKEGQYTTAIVLNENSCNIAQEETTTAESFLEEIKKQAKSKENEIISTAIAFLDIPYIWAANGPNSFDCSGFTKYVFKENGMTIPRYSGNQAKAGIKVNYDELQVGDLVFFDTEKKYTKKVNHVGIYIGNDKFIHASSAKKKVIITSFKKKHFYKRRFLWGQRIVKDSSTYASL